MQTHFRIAIFLSVILYAIGGNIRQKKQVGTGITFAFPGLNLLGGGLGNNVGSPFGEKTFTRTIVSTVSTVTTASFRTCTTTMAAIAACAGRRRRNVPEEAGILFDQLNPDNELFFDAEANHIGIEPTASIALVIGTTTLTDPLAVSEYLEAHKPTTQNSIIYPADISFADIEKLQKEPSSHLTELYPSNDSPSNDQEDATTQIPLLDEVQESEPTTERSEADALFDDSGAATTPNLDLQEGEADVEKARVGLGKTSTVTTVIRVTSVATTLASGTSATLTITYAGCLPQSLPVSGVPVCT